MCGHFGLISLDGFSTQDLIGFETGLYRTGIERGEDSTGITQVFPNGSYKIIKALGTYPNLFYDENRDEFFNDSNLVKDGKKTFALLGHGRKATLGAVDLDNAHPFDFERMVGAHNGTIDKWDLYDCKYAKEFDNDSKIFFAEINDTKDNIRGAIKNLYSEIPGAMACVVFSKEDNSIFIWRNHARPFSFVVSRDGRSLMYASEFEPMWDAALRSFTTAKWDWKKLLKEMETTVHTLYEISAGDGDKLVIKEETMTPAPFTKKAAGTGTGFTMGPAGNRGSNPSGNVVTALKNGAKSDAKSLVVGKKNPDVVTPSHYYEERVFTEMNEKSWTDSFREVYEACSSPDFGGHYLWDQDMKLFVWYSKLLNLILPYHHLETHRSKSLFAFWDNSESMFKFFPSNTKDIPSIETHEEAKLVLLPKKEWFLVTLNPNRSTLNYNRVLPEGGYSNKYFTIDSPVGKFVIKDPNNCKLYWATTQLQNHEDLVKVTRENFFEGLGKAAHQNTTNLLH